MPTDEAGDSRASRVLFGAVVLLVTSSLAACGSIRTPTPQAAPRTEQMSVEGAQGTRALLELRTSASSRARRVPAGAARVWANLPLVFERLGIATSIVDLDGFMMGNSGFVARRIEDTLMGRFVDCGVRSGRPRADQDQITLYVVVQLQNAAEGGTLVTTFVDAYASPRGVTTGAMHCVTTGRLERRIVELVTELTGPA